MNTPPPRKRKEHPTPSTPASSTPSRKIFPKSPSVALTQLLDGTQNILEIGGNFSDMTTRGYVTHNSNKENSFRQQSLHFSAFDDGDDFLGFCGDDDGGGRDITTYINDRIQKPVNESTFHVFNPSDIQTIDAEKSPLLCYAITPKYIPANRGACGNIYKVTFVPSTHAYGIDKNKTYAIKLFSREKDCEIEKYFNIHIPSHPHIFKAIGFYVNSGNIPSRFGTQPDKCGIVMPYLDLMRWNDIPVKHFVSLLQNLIDAIIHLHVHEIVHGDIKPDNIFVEVKSEETLSLFLGDLGVACVWKTCQADNRRVGTPAFHNINKTTGYDQDLNGLGGSVTSWLRANKKLPSSFPLRLLRSFAEYAYHVNYTPNRVLTQHESIKTLLCLQKGLALPTINE